MATAPQLTDLEVVVQGWAWSTFLQTRAKDHSKLKFEDVKLEVNWNRVKFITTPPDYADERKLDRPASQVVFRSRYENWTDHPQEHSFQTERTTVSSCTTSVCKGFTKGMHLELKLGLPDDVAAATASFGREVTMETGEEDTQEESMTWAINSTIKVPPKHRTTAELVVKEQEFTASFKMGVSIRGRVLVVITNLRENNCFVQSIEGDFADIMKREGGKDYIVENRTVKWEIEGKCHFRFGVEQHVQLREEKIEES